MNHLKQVGLGLAMYLNDYDYWYPPHTGAYYSDYTTSLPRMGGL